MIKLAVRILKFHLLDNVIIKTVIIPLLSVVNISIEYRQNVTHKGKDRKILNSLPLSLTSLNLNISEEHVKRKFQKESFRINKFSSSMSIFVFIDLKESGNSDVDNIITPKSISKIFAVVRKDRVKYVTYLYPSSVWSKPMTT